PLRECLLLCCPLCCPLPCPALPFCHRPRIPPFAPRFRQAHLARCPCLGHLFLVERRPLYRVHRHRRFLAWLCRSLCHRHGFLARLRQVLLIIPPSCRLRVLLQCLQTARRLPPPVPRWPL